MPLFDTHAHYNDDAFDQNRKGLLDALPDAGVGAVVIPGVDVESSRSALKNPRITSWKKVILSLGSRQPMVTGFFLAAKILPARLGK